MTRIFLLVKGLTRACLGNAQGGGGEKSEDGFDCFPDGKQSINEISQPEGCSISFEKE